MSVFKASNSRPPQSVLPTPRSGPNIAEVTSTPLPSLSGGGSVQPGNTALAEKHVTILPKDGEYTVFCDSIRNVLLEIKRASSPSQLLLSHLEHLLRSHGGGKDKDEKNMRRAGYIVLAQSAQADGKHVRARAFLAAANKKTCSSGMVSQKKETVVNPFSLPPPTLATIGKHIQNADYKGARAAVAEVAKADNLYYQQKLELFQYVEVTLLGPAMRERTQNIPDKQKRDFCLLCNELGQFLSFPIFDDQWKQRSSVCPQVIFNVCELGRLYGCDSDGCMGYMMAKLCGACGGKKLVARSNEEVKGYLVGSAGKGHAGARYFVSPKRLQPSHPAYHYYRAKESGYRADTAVAHDIASDQLWRASQVLQDSSKIRYIKACCMSFEQLNCAIQKLDVPASRLVALIKKIHQRLKAFFRLAKYVDYRGIGSFYKATSPGLWENYNLRDAYQLLVDAAKGCHPGALKILRSPLTSPIPATAVDAWGGGENCKFVATTGSELGGGYVLNEKFKDRVVAAAYASLDGRQEGFLQFGLTLHAACRKAPKGLDRAKVLTIIKRTVFLADPELGARLQDVLDSSEWLTLCYDLSLTQTMLSRSSDKPAVCANGLGDFFETLFIASGKTLDKGLVEIFPNPSAGWQISEGVHAILERNGIVDKSQRWKEHKFCAYRSFESDIFDVNNLKNVANVLLNEIGKDANYLTGSGCLFADLSEGVAISTFPPLFGPDVANFSMVIMRDGTLMNENSLPASTILGDGEKLPLYEKGKGLTIFPPPPKDIMEFSSYATTEYATTESVLHIDLQGSEVLGQLRTRQKHQGALPWPRVKLKFSLKDSGYTKESSFMAILGNGGGVGGSTTLLGSRSSRFTLPDSSSDGGYTLSVPLRDFDIYDGLDIHIGHLYQGRGDNAFGAPSPAPTFLTVTDVIVEVEPPVVSCNILSSASCPPPGVEVPVVFSGLKTLSQEGSEWCGDEDVPWERADLEKVKKVKKGADNIFKCSSDNIRMKMGRGGGFSMVRSFVHQLFVFLPYEKYQETRFHQAISKYAEEKNLSQLYKKDPSFFSSLSFTPFSCNITGSNEDYYSFLHVQRNECQDDEDFFVKNMNYIFQICARVQVKMEGIKPELREQTYANILNGVDPEFGALGGRGCDLALCMAARFLVVVDGYEKAQHSGMYLHKKKNQVRSDYMLMANTDDKELSPNQYNSQFVEYAIPLARALGVATRFVTTCKDKIPENKESGIPEIPLLVTATSRVDVFLQPKEASAMPSPAPVTPSPPAATPSPPAATLSPITTRIIADTTASLQESLSESHSLAKLSILASVLSPPVFGLPQMGNTCYMNAAIQILFSMPSVVAFLDNAADKISKDEYTSSNLFYSYRTEEAENVFKALVRVWSVYQGSDSVEIKQALKSFRDIICKRYSEFVLGSEGETPALLAHLLSLLNAEWVEFYGMRAPYTISRMAVTESEGSEAKTLRRDNHTVVGHLALCRDKSTSFEDAMLAFLNSDVTWCENDDRKICFLQDPPEEFVLGCDIHGAKRITDIPQEFKLVDYLRSGEDVRGFFVQFPDDVAKAMDNIKGLAGEKIAELTAFSVFFGSAQLMSHGHYVAYRKHKGDWFMINDSEVRGPLQFGEVDRGLKQASSLAYTLR